jgi:hypothetical protein
MSDTRDSEIRAIEGDPSVGNSHEAATPGSRAGRIGLRDLLRRAHLRRGWRRARLFWRALTSFTLTLSAVFTVVVIGMLLIQAHLDPLTSRSDSPLKDGEPILRSRVQAP